MIESETIITLALGPDMLASVSASNESALEFLALGGPPGERGPAADTLDKTAAHTISGHRVVVAVAGGAVAVAEPATAGHAGRVVGITENAATAGSTVSVRHAGELVEPSWSWQVGPVWLGEGGTLTQTAPLSVFLLQVGVATAADTLLVKIGTPVFLS